MEYILKTEHLTKKYGKFKALDDLNMSVPKGSIYGFVGKNGAGKTTFIRTICGLQNPSSGSYSLYGIDNSNAGIARSRRRMGAVVEVPAIYLDLTAEQNLIEQGILLGLPSSTGVRELLALVGLSNVGTKKAKDFSLGMRQRLGIAIALVGDPDFLVLDEPINGLDPQGIIDMRELLIKLNRERQITILISSHILDELSRLATHYGFIDRGHLIKEIDASSMEEQCRKCTRIEVNDTALLPHALDLMGIEYRIHSNTEADLYAKPHVSQLTATLAKEGCEIISIQEKDESLESYFMNLVGGEEA